MPHSEPEKDHQQLLRQIRDWARDLGFQQLGIADINLAEHEAYLQRWLAAGYQGSMGYMGQHGHKRSRPEELVPGTCRVISVRNGLPARGYPAAGGS